MCSYATEILSERRNPITQVTLSGADDGIRQSADALNLNLHAVASLNDLRRNPVLNARSIQFVFQDPNAPGDAIYGKTAAEWFDILRIGDCDGPGALFARLHLLRCPGPIPDSLEGQAAYWKKHYNTILGKGTEEGYISAFLRLRPTQDA